MSYSELTREFLLLHRKQKEGTLTETEAQRWSELRAQLGQAQASGEGQPVNRPDPSAWSPEGPSDPD